MYRRPVLPQARNLRPPTTVARGHVKTVLEPIESKTAAGAPAAQPAPRGVGVTVTTLSDSMLTSLAARTDIRAEFPFVKPVVQSAGKTCCGAAKAARLAFQKQIDVMKSGLVAMSVAEKARFKELLHVGRVAIYLGGARLEF